MENRHTGGNEQQAVCIQAPLTYMSGLEAEPQSLRPICIAINIGSRCSDVNQASMMNLNKVVQQHEGRKHNAKNRDGIQASEERKRLLLCCGKCAYIELSIPQACPPTLPTQRPSPAYDHQPRSSDHPPARRLEAARTSCKFPLFCARNWSLLP